MTHRLCLLAWLGASAAAWAGHGFLNAFAGLEPLPAPGRTPDAPGYAFDGLAERARLAVATGPARLELLLAFAAEKLAELETVVRRENEAAAERAAAAYTDYLDAAVAAVAGLEGEQRADAAEQLALRLLEQQYLASLEYIDLPRGSRTRIAAVMATVDARYAALVATMPRSFRDAQFFKEEEVRWSWELARQADAQGL